MAEGDKFTKDKWNSEYVEPLNALVDECEKGFKLDPAGPHHRWSIEDDIQKARQSLIEICEDNEQIFDGEFDEKLEVGKWSNLVLEKLKQAIENGCCDEMIDCCHAEAIFLVEGFDTAFPDNEYLANWLVFSVRRDSTEAEVTSIAQGLGSRLQAFVAGVFPQLTITSSTFVGGTSACDEISETDLCNEGDFVNTQPPTPI